jgi:DNA-binding transcriptional regulator YiaG
MAKLIMVGGVQYNLSDTDSRRLENMVRKNGMNFRALDSGIMINVDNIAIIEPTPVEEIEEEIMEEEPEPIEEVPEPEPPRLHVGQLKSILDNSQLSQADFAKSIGYAEGTLRLALKEGRISQAFSDAVVEKYLKDE